MPILSDSLRALRLEAKLSQNKLAAFAEVDRQTVSRAERGLEISELSASKIVAALQAKLGREIGGIFSTE